MKLKSPDFGLLLSAVFLPFCALADCTLTEVNRTSLPDMAFDTYAGFQGGLYADYSNHPPGPHIESGLNLAAQIKPLNAAGEVDENNGRIVLVSIGMSNTSQEWASKGTEHFRAIANADPAKNPRVFIVDGAQGGQASTDWTNPASATWTTLEQRLSAIGATANQVQVLWMKHARRQPSASGVFPSHAQALQADLESILRICRSRYPNLKIAYLSSRTRAYVDNPASLNPEPYAYESAFSVKWLIEKQINQVADLNFDPSKGAVVAPWVAWGPYLWADGLVPRSDGFTWACTDVETDFTHPSASGGVPKVGRQLLAFFKTDPTATPWFLRKSVTGQPPSCVLSANVTTGLAPLAVAFSAAASDPDGTIRDYQWTFDDGTFATDANPQKTFRSPGVYTTRVTVTDNSGNSVTRSEKINVVAVSIETATLNSGHVQLQVSGMSDYDAVVQHSSNLTSWSPVHTNRGSFIYSGPTVSERGFLRVSLQP